MKPETLRFSSRCRACGADLPPGCHPAKEYCNPTCRMKAWVIRKAPVEVLVTLRPDIRGNSGCLV